MGVRAEAEVLQKFKDVFDYKAFKQVKHTHMMFEEFIEKVLAYNPKADVELIKKAYLFAHHMHKGQKRVSGETYFTHPLAVALILTKLRADSSSICAALLHDCVEDCNITLDDITSLFGEEIANLVDGVTKFKGIKFESKEEYSAENLRKVLIASTKDVRVILIKLADRLHNMRTIQYFPPEKQERIARETQEIYSPIANKLGIRFIKGELDDICLKVIDPESYKMIRLKIAETRVNREKKTQDMIALLKAKLAEQGIDSHISGRAKYFSSIYEKMKKEGKDFEDIYDLIALRIIVKTIPECYAALGIVHELWKPFPKHFKDYIAVPKANGYQSLHTSVVASHGKILEIQIRTLQMHQLAEEGIAAHWKYKGTERDKHFERKLSWLKHLLEWKQESKTAKEFVETLKIDLFEDEIVVFTPKGDPISLPEGASPVDFAYAVHTSLGEQCVKAEVNGHVVPLEYKLKSGDIVLISIKKNAKPMRGWLSFVKTSKARSKIRNVLNIKTLGEKKEEDVEQPLIQKLKLPPEIKPHIVKLSKCCKIAYGDPLIGFFTKDKHVTIHHKDCANIYTLDQSKTVPLSWFEIQGRDVEKMKILVTDRVGLLSEVMAIISGASINVLSINTRSKKDKIMITFKVKIPSGKNFEEILRRIRRIKSVLDVRRYDSAKAEFV